MRVLVVTTQVPFVSGGAEELAEGLIGALRKTDHEVDLVSIPFKWYPPERILDQMLACRLFDLSESNGTRIDQIIALKFPAYLINHPRKRIWLVHQHRQAYDLWTHPSNDLINYPNGSLVQSAIHRADIQCFQQSGDLFTISNKVSNRLKEHCGFDSIPLFPPPRNEHIFHSEEPEDFFFFPSRISEAKRQILVLRALQRVTPKTKVLFAGSADTPGYLEDLKRISRKLGVDHQVQWLGRISEEEKVSLYAKCMGVIFPPYDEDYGFITLEAMLSSKPIITCQDSGGPTDFVENEQTGLITSADPVTLSGAIDRIIQDRSWAKKLGQAGRQKYSDLKISWDRIVSSLLL